MNGHRWTRLACLKCAHGKTHEPPSRSGVRGIAFSMIKDLNELPLFRDEVLPRLERLGVRAAHN